MSDWADLQTKYHTFLVDLVGVIHDGLSPFPEAITALNQLSADKRLIFVSNTPRPGTLSIEKIKEYGLKREFSIITSGDYARFLLSQDTNLFYHWGAERNNDLLQGLSLNITQDILQADKVLLTAFLEEGEDPQQYAELMQTIIQRQLPVFCINPDKVAFHGKKLRKCAGYFAEQLAQQGWPAQIWGKPQQDFYKFVAEKAGPFQKAQCLMIGDTLETDILGAQHFGIDSLFVLSGISQHYGQQHHLTLQQLTRDIQPTYIATHLGGSLLDR